jgi:hypothetical protein
MFHKRSKQKRRDGKHMHISHANTGIKQQHFTQTARHVTTKYEVTKFLFVDLSITLPTRNIDKYLDTFKKLSYYFT